MGKQRRQFSAAFKAKVALKAIKGQRTVQEISSTFGAHPNQVAQWKRQALEQLPEIFSAGRSYLDRADEALKEELYQQIGRRQMKLAWLKKVWSVAISERRAWIERNSIFSMRQQCELAGIARSGLSYEPAEETTENLVKVEIEG